MEEIKTNSAATAPATRRRRGIKRKTVSSESNEIGASTDSDTTSNEIAISSNSDSSSSNPLPTIPPLSGIILKEESALKCPTTARDANSRYWEHFNVVINKTSKKLVGTAQCKYCKKLLVYKGNSTGTSSLGRHYQKCPIVLNKPQTEAKRDPVPEAKHKFTVACATYCARDLRAPESVSSPGMENLVQSVADLVIQYGAIDAKKLIPSPKTIFRYIKSEAAKAIEELGTLLVPLVEKKEISATTDGWTESHTQFKYFTLTFHFIDANWANLRSRVACTVTIETDSSAENLLSFLVDKLVMLGIPREMHTKIGFVTDGGSDIVKALEIGNFMRIYCAAHALNVIVRGTLSCTYHTLIQNILNMTPSAKYIIEQCNAWVLEARKFIPQNKKNKILLQQLKVSNSNSQSHVAMLLCVLHCREKVEKLLESRDVTVGHLFHIFDEEIEGLLEFLQPFDLDGTREKSSQVTSTRALALREHLAPSEFDSTMVADLKQACLIQLTTMEAVVEIDKCKEIVAYLKRSGISKELERTVKQEVQTRWSSQYSMLESLFTQWDDVHNALEAARVAKTGAAKKTVPSLLTINKALIAELLAFLKPFALHTVKLQGRKYPTLPYVLLAQKSLLVHTESKEGDSYVMSAVRTKAHHLLKEKLIITDEHKVALFLWPRMKELLVFETDAERTEVQNLVRTKLQQYAPTVNQEETPQNSAASAASTTDDALYGNFMIRRGVQINEVDRYLAMPESEIGDDSNLLQWWKIQGSTRFPHMTLLARKILHIPATSAASESDFSDAGRMISDNRTNTLPSNVNDTMVFRDHIRNSEI